MSATCTSPALATRAALWVWTVTLSFPRTGKTFEAPVVDDLPSLVWAVDLTTVEFHRVLARTADLASATAVLLDLDPGSSAGLLEPRRAGLLRGAELDVLWLPAYAKTSGGRGRGSEDSLR